MYENSVRKYPEQGKPKLSLDALWKQRMRRALAGRAVGPPAEDRDFTVWRNAPGNTFAQHMGREVARHVAQTQAARQPSYEAAAMAHCVHVVIRLKSDANLEDMLGVVLLRHALNKLSARVQAVRKHSGETLAGRPEVLLATVEQDGQGVHVHAVLHNRASVSLEIFSDHARAVLSGFTAVQEVYTRALVNDAALDYVVGYGIKRAVPIMAGRYPAVFLGSLYSAGEWRSLVRAFQKS